MDLFHCPKSTVHLSPHCPEGCCESHISRLFCPVMCSDSWLCPARGEQWQGPEERQRLRLGLCSFSFLWGHLCRAGSLEVSHQLDDTTLCTSLSLFVSRFQSLLHPPTLSGYKARCFPVLPSTIACSFHAVKTLQVVFLSNHHSTQVECAVIFLLATSFLI